MFYLLLQESTARSKACSTARRRPGPAVPECTAIVHGGGVGTVAAAVTHATPQLVCPSAFDQYDNGQRVARRGVAEIICGLRKSARRAVQAV